MRALHAAMVLLLVLAIALPTQAQTTTPVLTPPSDWVQIPRGFALTEFKNLWQGPKATRVGPGIFAQAILPIPAGLVSVGLAALQSQLTKSKTPYRVKTTQSRVCGASASVSTVRTGKGKTDAIIEATIYTKKALTYASLYARPPTQDPSPIENAIRNACPLDNGDIPRMAPPTGWKALGDGIEFELAGVWLGNGPMQAMWLIKAHQIARPEVLADTFKPMVTRKSGKVTSEVSMKHMTFCGQPGVLVNTRVVLPPGFGIGYDLAAAAGTDATYILSYLHPSSFNDPGAQQALTTLCGGPAPSPSASPTP